ncbi:MAG: DUF427 domain-containing protein [Ilumatobacteraceae bacterium]
MERGPNGKPIESVWDFPRPPRIERVDWRVRVVVAGVTVVDAPSALRVLETSQAPAYYVSFEHVADEHLRAASGRPTYCEWKGLASYADIVVGDRVSERAAWSYAEPTAPFAAIRGHWAFYAQAVDECWIDDERVAPNDGDFYGGWITSNVTGPFKGGPGTLLW